MSKKKQEWFVYIVMCRDCSFYTGVTIDVQRRVSEHNNGKGGRYTRSRLPVKLVCWVQAKNKSFAYKIESVIKKAPARNKVRYLTGATDIMVMVDRVYKNLEIGFGD